METSFSAAIAVAVALVMSAFPALAQQMAPKVPVAGTGATLVAVLDLEAVGADKNLVVALSDRLREGLLKTGKFVLVNRDQMDAILSEQAFQQTGCTSQECAVKVGKVLGVREIVSGRVIKLDETHWQLSAVLTSVETAQTLRTDTSIFAGNYLELLEKGMPRLAARFADDTATKQQAATVPTPAIAPPATPTPPRAAPITQQSPTRESSSAALPWIPGLVSLGFAAGAWNQAQVVTDSNAKQKDLAVQAKQATSPVQYQSLLHQIAEQKKKGQDATTLSNELAVGSALFAAWAIYLAVHEHENGVTSRVMPVPAATGGTRLMVVWTW